MVYDAATMAAAKSLPALIVVTGRPGAGKTTLAHELVRAVRCPLISRDEIKEGLVNTTGQAGAAAMKADTHVYDVFFETIELLLRRHITLVIEAAFQHKLWAPKLTALRELAQIRIVLCNVEPEVARTRHVDRGLTDAARERFHNDRAYQEQPAPAYDPPHIVGVQILEVDTTSGYRPPFTAIVSFAHTPTSA